MCSGVTAAGVWSCPAPRVGDPGAKGPGDVGALSPTQDVGPGNPWGVIFYATWGAHSSREGDRLFTSGFVNLRVGEHILEEENKLELNLSHDNTPLVN